VKNLGRTIDQLIKIEPSLEEKLSHIKNKWKRSPAKTMAYWKELIEYLNSEPLVKNHPRWTEMRDVVVPKKRAQKKVLSSFDILLPTDTVVGIIPENISDKIRRQDIKAIKFAKMRLEAGMTKDVDLLANVNRRELILEIETKKVWVALKDHFVLWSKPISHIIKRQEDGLFVLVELPPAQPSHFVGGNMVKMDPNTMRNFFKFLGLNPPESEDDSPQM
jgi:hypothetical protein